MTKDDKWVNKQIAVPTTFIILFTYVYVFIDYFIHWKPMSTCPEPTDNLFVLMKKYKNKNRLFVKNQ